MRYESAWIYNTTSAAKIKRKLGVIIIKDHHLWCYVLMWICKNQTFFLWVEITLRGSIKFKTLARTLNHSFLSFSKNLVRIATKGSLWNQKPDNIETEGPLQNQEQDPKVELKTSSQTTLSVYCVHEVFCLQLCDIATLAIIHKRNWPNLATPQRGKKKKF